MHPLFIPYAMLAAVAGTAAASASADLSPLYSSLNEFLAAAATAFAGWAVTELRVFLKKRAGFLDEQTDQVLAEGLNRALANGVNVGLHQLGAWETVHKDVAVKGAVQRLAVQYAIDHSPGALARFGLSPEELAQKALAFLPAPPPTAQPPVAVSVPAPVPVTVEATIADADKGKF